MINITPTGAWDYNESEYNESKYFDKSVADYIIKLLGDNYTLLDFGCGAGYYVQYIQEHSKNAEVIGVEPFIEKHTKLHTRSIVNKDLTENFNLNKKSHLMCLEVLEHIPSSLEDIAINNIVTHCSGYLIISWAKINQPGIGHINCKNREDVICLFKDRGYLYLENESNEIRSLANLPWLQNNLCIFKSK